MKLYCTVYYKACAYEPCSRLFVVSYLRYKVKMCSDECVALAARLRITPAEGARRARMRVTPNAGRITPAKVEKACEECGLIFRPFHGAQRWCKVCVPGRGAWHRMKRCGVSEPQWQRLVARYDGLCWICKKIPPTCLDHDHKTGRPRGALCHQCNVQLGAVERDGWLADAGAYLNDWGPSKPAGGGVRVELARLDQLSFELATDDLEKIKAPRKLPNRHRAPLIRAWAKEQGMRLADHGSLPKEAIRAYEEAHAA